MVYKIPLSDADVGEEEIEEITRVVRSRWLSMGPITRKLEKQFSRYLGVKHAFCVSSCSAALHLANIVLDIKTDDEVIVPSLTFVATANSILYCKARPVFADVTSLDDWNISPDDINEKITDKTKAIIVVHYGGYACDMGAILEIASDHNLNVIEDAAHAPGAEYQGKKCGGIGDIGCFSFYSNKNIVTGEGGLIVTNDQRKADRIRILRSHGMSALSWDKYRGHAFKDDITDLGYNYRLNELSAAMGTIQLRKLNRNNRRRYFLVREYRKQLGNNKNIALPFLNHKEKSSYHIFPILLLNKSRKKFMKHMKKNGIQTNIHYHPVHLYTYYRNLFRMEKGSLPKTEYIGDNTVSLPLHPLLSHEDMDDIITTIKNFL
jgi:dTDP-4-amino-4,6-dideoxygalactose transaminase